MSRWLLCLLPLSLTLAQDPPAPEWAGQAVWYQIFVERFWNGDSSNDPVSRDAQGAWPHQKPPQWQVTPWDWDWYQPDPWVRPEDGDFYTWVHHRRYGGDLQGVLERLDELQELGVTALYLNPVNDAPSLHKYDARNWHHVDRCFGPDPGGDEALIALENPADPASWQWTAADKLLLSLVKEAHGRGMRVILDFSWNHTGTEFWAFQDLRARGKESPFKDWYQVKSWDNPRTAADEFEWEGWAGIRELPAVRQTGEPAGKRGGLCRDCDLDAGVKAHVFAVTRRWLDPNGDGDPSDGVDGYRLDVAEQVPLGFWLQYRAEVKRVNPAALLVGEIWWERWPLDMMDPRPWLEAFDSVMHYQWYMPVRSFFAETTPWLTASGLAAQLDSLYLGMADDRRLALMNLCASHDTPRLATCVANRGRYKFQVNPRENSATRLGPPAADDVAVIRLIRVLQYTWPGAPHIWNGDEYLMWGADDPDNRKPVVRPGFPNQPESARPFGDGRQSGRVAPVPVTPDLEHRDFLAQLARIRQSEPELFSHGGLRWVVTDDERGLLGYERALGDRRALVLFNRGGQPASLSLELAGTWRELLQGDAEERRAEGATLFHLPPRAAQIWLLEP
ncbi:MAG: alpha-amylase family glycosyl hydrolase [Candidatus Delongbacteria bacterium]